MDRDFALLCERAQEFKERIRLARRELEPTDFEWYPYDTFTAFPHLNRMLTGKNRSLFEGRKRILDLGCQDGELSFFLEQQGHEIVAIDYPTYNHNGMRGVRALRAMLRSEVQLCEVDVDRQFILPGGKYDIAIMLGVLYHLRNPFYVLEELARHASYCIISTRIARRFPDGTPLPRNAPVAYLLDERELNDDETNYFIFSEDGLRTLLSRSHWQLCDFMTTGRSQDSDPVRLDRDERAFCLIKSCYDRLGNIDLLEGWHQPEESGWRWTQQEFSARVQWESQQRPRSLHVDMFVPEDLISRVNPLHMRVSANQVELTPESFRSVGPQKLIRKLPRTAEGSVVLRFGLSGAIPPEQHDPRERGIIITSIRVE
jgi:tRNA (mo5U34)-methyltransferase